MEACEVLGEDRYDPDPLLGRDFVNLEEEDPPIVNPYVSVEPGHTYVLRAGEEEEEFVVVHVTEETQEVQGVTCRIVVDIVFELSDEGGILRDLDGSFESGIDWANAGVLIMNDPLPGIAHRQEFAPGEAEDIVQYVSLVSGPTDDEGDDNAAFPCGGTGCLRTFDFAPIDPESTEYKFYILGVGFVLALGLEDGEFSGDREEMVCTGDSLDVLESDACGIDDVETVLEELCKISPDAFCADD